MTIRFVDSLIVTSETTAVDPKHPFSYAQSETPPNYKCSECGAANCKLWREYQTSPHDKTLLCARCAAKAGDKDISSMDEYGRWAEDPTRPTVTHDQIGWYVPAVPTEDNDTYWGYTSVPHAGCLWWANLPTFPTT